MYIKFEIYQDKKLKWRWRLRAANSKIIASGCQPYEAEEDCRHGIKLVKGTDEDTPIELVGW